MTKTKVSIFTLIMSTNLMMAGGDISPITIYENNDVQAASTIEVLPPKVVASAPKKLEQVEVSPIYVGLGLVAARYDSRCTLAIAGCDGIDKTGGILARVGYDFNEYMGVEARALMTSYKDDGGKIQHYGAFVKPMYPVTDGLNAYGLVGFAKTTTSGTLRKTDVSGLAFGAGIEYDFSDDKKKDAKYNREFDGLADQETGFGVFADYERLYYKSGSPDLDAVSIGVTYDF